MDPLTRQQLLTVNRIFYEVHAAAFDRSRGDRPWPGWLRLIPYLRTLAAGPDTGASRPAIGPVLDVGCGNARFACFLDGAGFSFGYTGGDANYAFLGDEKARFAEERAKILFDRWVIQTGATDGIRTEVTGGLRDDERIVTKGAILVKLAQATGALDAHSGHVH